MNTQTAAEKKEKSTIKLSLDNALRYFYYTLRYRKGCYLVAIEFQHGGKTWRADTVREAIELREKLEAIDRGEVTPQASVWDLGKVTDVLNALGKLQQQLLFRVYEIHEAKSWDLVVALGLKSEVALAGVLSGLSKQVKEHGIEMNDILRIDVNWHGKVKERHFSLNIDFETAAESVGWPESWQSKMDMEALDALDKKLEH
jgi:hypothetical protein